MIGSCRFCNAEIKIDPGEQGLCADCSLMVTKYSRSITEVMVKEKLQGVVEHFAAVGEIEPRINEVIAQAEVRLENVMRSQEPVQNAQELSELRGAIDKVKKLIAELANTVNKNNIDSVAGIKKVREELDESIRKYRARIGGLEERLIGSETEIDKLSGQVIAMEGEIQKPRIGLGRGIL